MKKILMLSMLAVVLVGCAGNYHKSSDPNYYTTSNGWLVTNTDDTYRHPGYVGASYNYTVADENNNEFVRRSYMTYPDPNPRHCSNSPYVRRGR